jgi:hypothetical protein
MMKHYFILGYDECEKLTAITADGFSELSAAIEYLEMIPKWMKPFVCVRLINV